MQSSMTNSQHEADTYSMEIELDDDIKLDRKDLRKFERDWKTKDNFAFSEFVLHIENFIQKKINKGIENSIRVVLQKSVSYID